MHLASLNSQNHTFTYSVMMSSRPLNFKFIGDAKVEENVAGRKSQRITKQLSAHESIILHDIRMLERQLTIQQRLH